MSRRVDAEHTDFNSRPSLLDYLFRGLAILSVAEVGALACDLARHPDAPGIISQGLLPRIIVGLIAGPSVIGFSALLLWRAPRHVIGRVLLLAGVAEIGLQFAFEFGSPVLSAVTFEVLILFLTGIVAPSFAYLLCTFPTGTVFPPRWAGWIKGAMVIKVLGGAIEILASQNQVGHVGLALNPLFVPTLAPFHPLVAVTVGMRGLLWPLVILAGIASLGLRYRVAEARVRQQIKWVVWPPLVGIVGALVALAIRLVTDVNAWGLVQMAFFTLAQLALIASLTSAILWYRLFDIDRLINRTLVYGLLTVGVIAFYGLIVALASALFQSSSPSWVALVATGVVAILFEPVRARLQQSVNRLMYGARDEPYAALSLLGRRLEATLAPDTVLPTIVETVAQALKLPYAAIELETDDQGRRTEAVFPPSAIHAPSDLERWPLTYQNQTVGHLLLAPRAPNEPFTPGDRRLLADFARQAGVAAHAVQLTKELERSRERMVTAREEERHRLQRDLHDGLGPALAAQVLKVGSARALLAQDSGAADKLLVELEQDIEAALADIRRLVYELRPPVLDQLGLSAAIRMAAQPNTALRPENGIGGGEPTPSICVQAPEPLPALPAAVEVAAYRIAQEALTNVVRHAHARTCVVRIAIADVFSMEILDDGRGLPAAHRLGVGLASMRARTEELGGTCVIERRDGGGTRVCVKLPLNR